MAGPFPGLQVKTSIPGFYKTFKDKLRNLSQGCDTTIWLCLQASAGATCVRFVATPGAGPCSALGRGEQPSSDAPLCALEGEEVVQRMCRPAACSRWCPSCCCPLRPCARTNLAAGWQRAASTGQTTFPTLCLLLMLCLLLTLCLLQDMDKLQPGALYLDRQPQSKHLPLSGTKYSSADVDRLWAALETLAVPALPSA